MGFHKKWITKDLILSQNSFEDITGLFNADALIFDTWSSNFFKFFDDNYEIYQEKRNTYIEENRFSSAPPVTDGFDNQYISNILINLKTNPSWLDIALCIGRFRPIDIPKDVSGKFDLLCNFCIFLIEKEFEKNEL